MEPIALTRRSNSRISGAHMGVPCCMYRVDQSILNIFDSIFDTIYMCFLIEMFDIVLRLQTANCSEI